MLEDISGEDYLIEGIVNMTKIEMAKKILEQDGSCERIAIACSECPLQLTDGCYLTYDNRIKWCQNYIKEHEEVNCKYIQPTDVQIEEEEIMNTPMTGVKHDEDKLRWSLLPLDAVRKILEVFMFGAKKYGDKNWLGGMKWSRLYEACLRHLTSFFGKEDSDEESKLPHLAHAGCCILMLLTYQLLNLGEDDR